ncbi:hypothetical protein T069G_07928 [Trichoderma breve]|uniref:Uncharacterized protein n=1 Tax=Trichoderma breve TaxID=2034170 RepID=A0A9W9E728_9HYPO|nr:hypothetical protein T069G_07928 [Trichoderma breve]KAJ4857031.1 hypothetical protein T069G_07928 [Trichoderma breve]
MGESDPIPQSRKATVDDDTGQGDRLNVVYSSTTVTKGGGRGIILATSMYTGIGHIAITKTTGTKNMLEIHVIFGNLSSLEALGGVRNICSDKTGQSLKTE